MRRAFGYRKASQKDLSIFSMTCWQQEPSPQLSAVTEQNVVGKHQVQAAQLQKNT